LLTNTESSTDNPTKVVALKFEAGVDEIPLISAQASGELAKVIIREAGRLGIPVVRQADLTEELSGSDTDSEIPSNTFQKVAQVLAGLMGAR